MPTADPRAQAGAGEPDPSGVEDADLASAPAGDLDELRAREDLPGLLALARAFRSGSAPGGRDLERCLSAYRAAAELGSAEAEYAVALFLMNGGSVVAQDLKEGTMRLRAAAEKGSVPAKVFLGNLYELGIHYKPDPEKADVWYRNAARGARVEAEPGSSEFTRELAELGAARHVLSRISDTSSEALDEGERARLLARAKAHGYGLRVRDGSELGDRATFADALSGADPRAARSTGAPPTVDVGILAGQRLDATGVAAPTQAKADRAGGAAAASPTAPQGDGLAAARASARRRGALAAFGYALLFAAAGVGAGYAAALGARELLAHGHTLPLLGARTHLVFPVVLGVVGVLPACLVYKLGTVVKSLLLGAAVGGLGWVAWGTGRAAYHPERPVQTLAFALAGFLAALLVLGMLGGAKAPRAER